MKIYRSIYNKHEDFLFGKMDYLLSIKSNLYSITYVNLMFYFLVCV